MKQVGGECPLQGIMPTGKGTPGHEARVFLAFNVLLPLNKCKKCIYALRESSKAWQVIWVFPDDSHPPQALQRHPCIRMLVVSLS